MARKRDSDEGCLKILRQVELDLAGGAEKALSEAAVRSGRLFTGRPDTASKVNHETLTHPPTCLPLETSSHMPTGHPNSGYLPIGQLIYEHMPAGHKPPLGTSPLGMF